MPLEAPLCGCPPAAPEVGKLVVGGAVDGLFAEDVPLVDDCGWADSARAWPETPSSSATVVARMFLCIMCLHVPAMVAGSSRPISDIGHIRK